MFKSISRIHSLYGELVVSQPAEFWFSILIFVFQFGFHYIYYEYLNQVEKNKILFKRLK